MALRRTFVLLLTLLATLAACGSETSSFAPASPAPSGPITIKHTKGELTLPGPATRVVACSEETLDLVLTLGVQPVGLCSERVEGAANGQPFDKPYFYTGVGQLGNPTFVGSAQQPSLEEIIKLKPDLILVLDYTEGQDKLAQIAPVMVVDASSPDYWSGTLVEVGKAVGREAQAQQFLKDFEATAATLRTQMEPIVAQSPDVLLVYSFGASDGTMVFNEKWSGSQMLTKLGFKLVGPEGVTIPDSGFAPVSPEILTKTGADTIMVIRPKNADGSLNNYPIDDLFKSAPDLRVVYQLIDSTRGSSAPLTDKFVLEEFARLMSEAASARKP